MINTFVGPFGHFPFNDNKVFNLVWLIFYLFLFLIFIFVCYFYIYF